MEFLFSQLKQKDVINLHDGKNLGRVCDITVNFPEADFIGITVTGCKGFKFTKQDKFIPVNCIVKIGADAILVKLEGNEKYPPSEKSPKRPPKHCPPPHGNCPSPNNCPPHRPPAPPFPQERRSYDEYE